MTNAELQQKIAAIRAAREQRGMDDPLNRLRAYIADAIAGGAEPIKEQA